MASSNGSKKKLSFVPADWSPRLLEEMDGRLAVVKEIKRRMDDLCEDAGVDSTQKRMLASQAVFVNLQLETMQAEALETGEIQMGVYYQAVNCLVGLLKALGLDRKVQQVTLRQYVQEKTKRRK